MRITLICVFFSALPCFAQQEKMYPGMSFQAFTELTRFTEEDLEYNQDYEKSAEMFGTQGNWSFSFGYRLYTLNSVDYRSEAHVESKSIEEQNAFKETYRDAVEQAYKELRSFYGEPAKYENNLDSLGLNELYYTADYFSAAWDYENVRISLKLDFLGTSRPQEGTEEQEFVMNAHEELMAKNKLVFQLQQHLNDFVTRKEVSLPNQLRYKLGMSPRAFSVAYPEFYPDGFQIDGDFEEKETINGLKGKWSYDIREDTLHHVSYRIGTPRRGAVGATEIKSYAKAAKELHARFEKVLGPPAILYDSTEFVTSNKMGIFSKKVYLAEWIDGNIVHTVTMTKRHDGKGVPTSKIYVKVDIYRKVK